MSNANPQQRYSQQAINKFVSSHRDQIKTPALPAQQIQLDSVFTNTSKPAGPVDLVYFFVGDQQKPALGFKQVDGEQDEETMFAPVYVDPELKSEWESGMGR